MAKEDRVISYIKSYSESKDETDDIVDYLDDMGYSYKNNQWFYDGQPASLDKGDFADDLDLAIDAVQRERYAEGKDDDYVPRDDDDVEWLHDYNQDDNE